MSRRTLAAVFVAALIVALAATLPLRLVIAIAADEGFAAAGLSAVEASGTAWLGRLRAAEWRGVPQGEVAVSLRPLSLLAGTGRTHLAGHGFSVDVLQGRSTGFENASGQLDVPVRRPLAAVAQLSFADASLVFIDGRCHEARGTLTAQLAQAFGAAVRMEGSFRCDGDRGRLALAAVEPAKPPTEATLAIDARGRVEMETRVRPLDDASRLALQAAGFRPTPEGLVRLDSWRLAN